MPKTVFLTEDGEQFDTQTDAIMHEKSIKIKEEDKFSKWLNESYYSREYNYKNRLDEIGIWHIEGEDPNADFGGHHYTPDLGYYRGTLEQAIRKAVSIKKFYSWGAGGDITKIEVIEL